MSIETSENKEPKIFSIKYDGDNRFFVPRLKDEYPELADIAELQSLNTPEVYLCFLIGCNHSKYNQEANKYPDDPESRIKIIQFAVQDCYGGSTYKLPANIFNDYMQGIFPEKIKAGIDRFKRFKLKQRYQAQLIDELMFDTLLDNIRTGKSNLLDVDDRKKFADLCKVTAAVIEELLPRLEKGFGYKTKSTDNSKEESMVEFAMKRIADNGIESFLSEGL